MDGAACDFGATTERLSHYEKPNVYEKITDPWNPMCWLMWEPDEQMYAKASGNPAFEFNDASNSPEDTEGISVLHSHNGGNAVCICGTVQFVLRTKFRVESDGHGTMGPGGRTLCWWAPDSANGH